MMPQTGKKKRISPEEESRITEDQWHRYVRARDNGHTDYIKMAHKCNDMYRGEQWDPADKAKLEQEGRPALTINMILSTVNAVLGENANNAAEFRFIPKAEGQEHTPGILTKLAEAIKDHNHYQWIEQQVFSDGVIQDGRGFFDVRVKFDDNLMGEVKITAEDPTTIMLDPDAKEYDPATWTEVFKTEWLSLDQLESVYGAENVKKVKAEGLNLNTFGADSIMWEETENTFGEILKHDDAVHLNAISDEEERTIRQVRIIERQHIRMAPTQEFVDMMTGDTKLVPSTWPEERVMQFAQTYGLGIVNRVKKRVRWTVTADRVLLHDDWSPYATFTKIPYFAYFRRGKPFGLVTNLISPQEQLNKLASQELHIINTTANSGWIMERGSLSGMTADDLRNQGAETGIVLEVNPGRQGPEKIQPNKVPSGIERAALKSADFIKEISGVNRAQLGFDSPEVSGVALQQKKMQGQVQLQVPFENLQRSRHMVACKMLELIQQFYTEPRVFKVISAGLNPATMDQKEQEYMVNQQMHTGEVLNDITVGKYDVAINVVPSRDSFQDQQFAEALSLRNVGVLVPDDRIVEYSHLAHKEELADEIREMQGRGDMTEEQMQMQQMMQQIQMQMMMLEVEKAAAEVQKLQAEAAKFFAETDINAPEYQIEKEKMEVELVIAREQLAMRRELAQIQSSSQIQTTAMKNDAQKDTAALVNRTKLASSNASNNLSLVQSREKNMADLRNEQERSRQATHGLDRPTNLQHKRGPKTG